MLPTGFRTFYFVSFLYVFFFSFLLFLFSLCCFRFFAFRFFFVSFRCFSPCFLFVFFSFRFFLILFVFFPFLSLQVPNNVNIVHVVQNFFEEYILSCFVLFCFCFVFWGGGCFVCWGFFFAIFVFVINGVVIYLFILYKYCLCVAYVKTFIISLLIWFSDIDNVTFTAGARVL